MSRQAAQNSFFLSARPEEGTQTNYFRPKEVTKIVFPDVGMIMYPLFWVKYGIYLDRYGYDLGSQSHLYLWAERDDDRDPTESVLYYSLLGKYWAETTDEQDISVGESAATEWIFEPSARTGHGPYDEVYEHFRDGVTRIKRGDPVDLESFTTDTRSLLSQRFRSKCAEHGVSFTSLFAARLDGISLDTDADTVTLYEGVVRAFVRAVVEAFEAVPTLHRKRLGETIIGSNISFTQPLLEGAPPSTLDRLANTRFAVSADEANAFLEAVQHREWGEYLVGSILLIATIGPFQDNASIMDELRQLPQLYESRDDIVTSSLATFPDADFAPAVRDALQELSYFWSVNYFLADGEDLARKLFTAADGDTFTQADVDTLFATEATAQSFEDFLELSHRDQYARQLADLIDLLEEMGESDVAEFLRTYEAVLGEGLSTTDTFLELLKAREMIIPEDEYYQITAPFQDNDSAGFYGVSEVISWTKTLVAAQANE
jgi:hypothetical protein